MPVKVSPPRVRKRRWILPSGETRTAWQLDFTSGTDGAPPVRHRRSFPTKEAALAFYESARAELAEGPRAEAPRIPTLGEFVEQFHEEGSTSRSAQSVTDERIRTRRLCIFLRPETPLDAITARDLDRYKASRLASGAAPGTVWGDVATIRRMFRLAIRWGVLKEDPSAALKKPRVPEGEVVFLEVEDQRRLVEAAERRREGALHNAARDSPHMLPLVILALHTGLRKSELLNLRWGQIDEARETLRVANAAGFRTKSGKGRTVGLSPDALAALTEWRAWFAAEIERAEARSVDGTIVPKLRRDAAARLIVLRRCEPRADRLVFPSFRRVTPDGEAAPLDNMAKAWRGLLLAAFGDGGKLPARYRIGLHALRHTFAVTLARQGVPLTTIKAAMGHASIKTTEVYLRFHPDEGRDAARRLPALRGTNPAQAAGDGRKG